MHIRSIFLLLLIPFHITISRAQEFKAGAAVRNITPDPLLAVSGGVGLPKPATKKSGELSVRALVLEKGSTRIAIVNIDNLGWPAALGNRSRALIKEIRPENILIGVTHTHSAPDAYGFPDGKGGTGADTNYLNLCVKKIADAVNEAIHKLQPASLKITVGNAKGKISYNYYADKLFDPRCGVIQAIANSGSSKGKVIATLVNYAIHPEVIGNSQGILGPDLCGPLYERIEQRTGGIALFMNGAQGGMVTADNRLPGGKEANDVNECKRIGNLLADESLRLLDSAKLIADPDLYCTARMVSFPVESKMMQYIMENSPVLKQTAAPDHSVSTQINLINLGPAQILTIPGEALPNIGYYVKRNMHTEFPFLFGLTNDAFGYILTKVDFSSFERYDYISETSLGENTGEIYIREALKLVAESPVAR